MDRMIEDCDEACSECELKPDDICPVMYNVNHSIMEEKVKEMRKAKDPKPDPLPRKEAISIQPGDVVVITLVRMQPPDEAYKTIKSFTDTWPDNKVIFLRKDESLEVYREQVKDEA